MSTTRSQIENAFFALLEMTSAYSLKGMPDFIKTSLDPFRNVAPI